MPPCNAEREEKIHRLWRIGETIDQISLQTRIPRSTVGYYVRKLNRSGRQRLVSEPVAPAATIVSTLESLMTKALFTKNVIELLKSGDFQKLYYFLQSIKTLIQMQSYITLTKEEKDLLQTTSSTPTSETEERTESKPELTREKTMVEICELDQQRTTCKPFSWGVGLRD